MSQTEVIVDEQALVSVSDSMNTYIKAYRETLEGAIRKLKLNSEDWNDEDFNILLSAISAFRADIEEIEIGTNQLTERIKNKISAIHKLHNMKI